MRKQTLAFFVVVWWAVGLYAAPPSDSSGGSTLSNRYVRLEFDPKGMGLSALVDLQSGVNHIRHVKEKQLLGGRFSRGTAIKKVTNNDAPCDYVHVEKLLGDTESAVTEWNDVRWWNENRVLTGRVTGDLPADSGNAQWRISVPNRSDYGVFDRWHSHR